MDDILVTIDDCRISNVDVGPGSVEYTLNGDRTTLTVDRWVLRLDHTYPGCITAEHCNDNHKVDYTRKFSLANGTLLLMKDHFCTLAAWKDRCTAATALHNKFGITKIIHADPNTTYEGFHSVIDSESVFSALCVLTDGETIYTCNDEFRHSTMTADSVYDPEFSFRIGKMLCEVNNASWAVVVNESFNESTLESQRDVVLYTLHRNPSLLALNLEQFLLSNEYAHFSDCMEELKYPSAY